ARLIARYGKEQHPVLWQPPEHYAVTLAQLQALSEQLTKQHTALLNQREAFKCSGMMEEPTRELMGKALQQVEKLRKELQQQMEALAKQHHQQMLRNLTSIPGIGMKTAMVLIIITGGFTRFAHYKQLCAYVGLSPRIFESGTSVKGAAHICKLGMSRIRVLLYI